jgi:predicted ATPase
LDWSYEHLSTTERAVLQRLSVLPGPFGLQAALDRATSHELRAAPVIEALSGLVAKSLIVAQTFDSGSRYQLLAATRAYAHEKLTGGRGYPATPEPAGPAS